MKTTIPQEVLAAVTAWAAGTARIGRAPVTPVLAGLMLTASPDGTLTAAAFDYEVSATATATAETGEPGRALVNGRMLAQAAAMLPAGREVTIATDGTFATLTAGSVSYRLMLLPADEYPALPAPGEPAAEFGADHLAAAVAQAVTAAGHDDTLPALTGVRLTLADGTATMAATDRYRLAIATCPYAPSGDGGPPGPLLIPARDLAAMARKPAAATVTLGLSGTSGRDDQRADPGLITLTAGDRQVTMRLLSGEYPKWGTLIPAASGITTTVTADLPVITAAVKRGGLVAERNTPVRLSITEGEIGIESGTGDEAQYAETIPARLDGDPVRVCFNPAYLLDTLSAIAATGASTVRIAITGPARPALITPDDPPGTSPVTCRHVLMPIRGTG